MRLGFIILSFFVFLGAAFGGGLVFFVPHTVNEAVQGRATPTPAPKAFILSAVEPDYFPLRDFNVAQPEIFARSAALYDSHSDKFLYQKNATRQFPIASLTKLMTAVVVLENLNLNSVITVPVEDINVDGYGADLVPGEKIRGSELLKVMLIKSSNDAALAFQSEAKNKGISLVQKMNEKAAELGMNSTRFTNPAGLDDAALSTAQDLVKLVQYVSKYRLIWDILLKPELDVASMDGLTVHHLVNTDQLLQQIPGILGGKTGFTDRAKGTMILLVDADGGRSSLTGVILGADDRFAEMRKLIEWGRIAHRWH